MRNTFFAAAVMSAMALAACGDGTGPGNGGGQLTQSEALQLQQAIFNLGADVGEAPGFRANRSATTGQASGTFTFEFNETAPCDPSGDVDMDGIVSISFDDETETSGMSGDIAVRHNDCAYRLDNGDVIRLTGAPDIDVTMDAVGGAEGLETMTIGQHGAFDWARDGASGSCEVDVSAEFDMLTGVLQVDGTFCGFDVSGTYSES